MQYTLLMVFGALLPLTTFAKSKQTLFYIRLRHVKAAYMTKKGIVWKKVFIALSKRSYSES